MAVSTPPCAVITMTSVRAVRCFTSVEQVHPVAVGHEQVGQDDRVRLRRVDDRVARRREPGREGDVEPLAPEQDREHVAQARLVVDDEDRASAAQAVQAIAARHELYCSLATAGLVSPAPTVTEMVFVSPWSAFTNFTVCAPGLTVTCTFGVLPSDRPSRKHVDGGIELMLRNASLAAVAAAPPPRGGGRRCRGRSRRRAAACCSTGDARGDGSALRVERDRVALLGLAVVERDRLAVVAVAGLARLERPGLGRVDVDRDGQHRQLAAVGAADEVDARARRAER